MELVTLYDCECTKVGSLKQRHSDFSSAYLNNHCSELLVFCICNFYG